MGISYPKRQPLSVAVQVQKMAKVYPSLRVKWERGEATWTGTITPLDGCSDYRVRISYRLEKAPRVAVLSPTLSDRGDGTPIPHRYSDGSLCLYFPRYGEWASNYFLVDTIVPWTSLWLYYYEVWLATGTWHGGGIHTKTSTRPPD
jgi:hypothetical protein